MESDDPLIAEHVAEFNKSLELSIAVKNITSNKTIVSKNKSPISILELLDKGFILSLPPLSGSQGHQLMLDVHLKDGSEEVLLFSTTAKILEIDPTDTEIMRTTVKFSQFDPYIWKKFLRIYQSCQNDLQELLSSLKGQGK